MNNSKPTNLELEEKLNYYTQALKDTQNLSLIGSWNWNIETDKTEWSDMMFILLGLEPNEFKPTYDLALKHVHDEDKERYIHILTESLSHKTPFFLENRIIKTDGSVISVVSRGRCFLDEDGNLIRMIGTVQDITALEKAKEIQLQLDAHIRGQESERARIATELHDSINPLLSLVGLNVDSLLENYKDKDDSQKAKLQSTLTVLESAVQGIREITNNLSSAVLKDFGLEKALKNLYKRVFDMGQLKITYHPHGLEERLNEKTELALYRIAQELINNILKHANATEAELQLIRHKETVVLMVNDNGVGFDEPCKELITNGFGFRNINARVQSLSGKLNIDSAINKGTTVTVELPL